MLRKIIKIDEEKCNGCGACASACHEGAIDMVDGKAKLMRENYCDGFGDCLPACPADAISFEMREAPAYDEAAVLAAKAARESGSLSASEAQTASVSHAAAHTPAAPSMSGCPGSRARAIARNAAASASSAPKQTACESQLQQWPVQIRLVPVNAPYFQGANLLIAADCTAYAYASFHQDFIRNRITLIGCPKLDNIDYSDKLQAIIENNDIKSVTIVRMEVPCCGGLEHAAKRALQASGKFLPWQVVTISTDGRILD